MNVNEEWSLHRLLIADVTRQYELFGGAYPLKGVRLYMRIFTPRFAPVLLYRLAYKAQEKRFGIIARFFSLINFVIFGIEIATACKIGPGLFFPHTQGTVIGAISIGKNAVIYQNVTLGAKGLNFTYDGEHRPLIGDDVILGAGCKVLGGILLGDRITVAANAVVLTSFPHGTTVGGIPARVIKTELLK